MSVVSRQSLNLDNVYPDLATVPDIAAYDYYVIATETSLHYEHLKYLSDRVRGKKILVEKPLFDQIRDFNEGENRIFVGYNLRFHPLIAALRNEIQHKKVLAVQIVAGQYLPSWRPQEDYRLSYSASKSRGGGVLRDLSHEIDYVQWIFGSLLVENAFCGKISDLEISSDDYAVVVGRSELGAIVTITADYLCRKPQRTVTVIGSESTYYLDIIEGQLEIVAEAGVRKMVTPDGFSRNYTYRRMHMEIIQGDIENACTLDQARQVMFVIAEVERAHREGWSNK